MISFCLENVKRLLLYFQIPADFFEAAQALHSSEVLKLDYYGRLDVYAAYPGTTQRLTASAEFNLYIRPHSPLPKLSAPNLPGS